MEDKVVCEPKLLPLHPRMLFYKMTKSSLKEKEKRMCVVAGGKQSVQIDFGESGKGKGMSKK